MAEVDLALALAVATSVRKLDCSWISAVKPEDASRPPAAPAGAVGSVVAVFSVYRPLLRVAEKWKSRSAVRPPLCL